MKKTRIVTNKDGSSYRVDITEPNYFKSHYFDNLEDAELFQKWWLKGK